MKQRNALIAMISNAMIALLHMFMGEVMMKRKWATKTIIWGHFVLQGNGYVSIVQCKITKVSKKCSLAPILTSYWTMGRKNNKNRTKFWKKVSVKMGR